MRHSIVALAVAALGAAVQAGAQDARTDFPSDAVPLAADALRARLLGQVFHVALADGTTWRLQYRDRDFFVNTSRGFADDGPWRVEGSRLCAEGRRIKPGCNEVRLLGDVLLLKRDSGEVVKLEPR